MALESIYGDFGQLNVICSPDDAGDGHYVLQVLSTTNKGLSIVLKGKGNILQ